MERGEVISHRFILFLNSIALVFLIGFTGINNLDVNVAMLLIGFSPSILALVINALMDKHIKEAYTYLFIPFISVIIFILFGVLFLAPLVKNMDFETLSSINFIFTIIFAFIYYFSSRKRKINNKREKIHKIEPSKQDEPEEEKPVEKIKKVEVEKKPEVKEIHHVHHNKEIIIEKEIKEEKKEKEYPFIEELKKDFNIININQDNILDALRELSSEKKDANIKDILNKLEKKHIYFASNTGEKYHKPLCIVINHITHDKIIAFKDESEAKMEGYKPCRVCMPEK